MREKLVKYIGYILVILSLSFIVITLHGFQINFSEIGNVSQILKLVAFLSLYMLIAVFSFSYAMKLNLEFLSNKKLKLIRPVEIYLKTNLCKYLPGNVMQYVSRNVYAGEIGITHTKMAFGTALELFFVAFTTLLLSIILGRELFFALIREYVPVRVYYIMLIVLIGCFGLGLLIFRKRAFALISKIVEQLKNMGFTLVLKHACRMIGILVLCHAISGTTFFFLLRAVSDAAYVNPLIVIPAVIISWFIGFVTPGSPGGIGVKEAVLSLLLMDFYGRENVLVAALLFRVVTVSADVLAFSFFMLFKKVWKSSNKK